MFLPIMEVAAATMIIAVIFTQIIIPGFRGTPLFPVLQQRGIEAQVATARQELRIIAIENELASLKQQVSEGRNKQGE